MRKSRSALKIRRQKRIPKHFDLHMPPDQLSAPVQTALKSIPGKRQYTAQTRDRTHRVRRGDTLSTIARHYEVGVSELVAINDVWGNYGSQLLSENDLLGLYAEGDQE